LCQDFHLPASRPLGVPAGYAARILMLTLRPGIMGIVSGRHRNPGTRLKTRLTGMASKALAASVAIVRRPMGFWIRTSC